MKKTAFTLIEVMMVSSILAIALLTAALFITDQQSFATYGHEKKFGYEKAMQLLNEVKTYQERLNSEGDLIYLDDLSDGTDNETNPLLTAQIDITDPKHPISSNILTGSDPSIGTHWKYSRRILVRKDYNNTNSKDVRKVGVQVFLTSKDKEDNILLAEVWSIIQTAADPYFPPTQVYDIYALAIENVPGWWVYMNNLIPQVENAIKDLEGRNPGLEFRVHWITKMGYGRNPFYLPQFNTVADSKITAYNTPYYYPAVMPDGSATSEYYVPSLVHAAYKDETNTLINGYDTTDNPAPYTLADAYNTSQTYPLLLDTYAMRLAHNPDEEMPYALLLDDMHLNPDKYHNALFINLHGELLPVPAIRNYADAAKHPSSSEVVSGTLTSIVAETSHAVLRHDITATDTTVSVSQLQKLANDDAFEANDYIRIGSEICLITSIDTTRKQLTLSRGKLATVASSHIMLTPLIHQSILSGAIDAVEQNLNVSSTKGLAVGETLSVLQHTGLKTMGTITSINVPASKITINARLDLSGWAADTPLVCSSAVPTLNATITAAATSTTYHNGGAASPIAAGDILNIGGELLLQNATSITRAQYGSTGEVHQENEVIGHVTLADAIRVVTHPENIRYHFDQKPQFRVYAYLSDSAPHPTTPKRLSSLPITLLIKMVSINLDNPLTDDWIQLRQNIITSLSALGITRIEGGVKPASSRYDSSVSALNYPTAPSNDAIGANDDEMYARIDPVFIRTSAIGIDPPTGNLSIAIRLYNTPVSSPYLATSRGLKSTANLYGLEYIPAPLGGDFTKDLTTTGTDRKNTARWIVPFPDMGTVASYTPPSLTATDVAAFFAPLKVETRIGDINIETKTFGSVSVNEIIPGVLYGELSSTENLKVPSAWPTRTENFTQTHTWSHNIYDASSNLIPLAEDKDIPFSDKYQFMGDPRYEPCADVLAAGHHNLFFSDTGFNAVEGMGTVYEGWGDDDIEVDIPRLMQMVREAMMETNSVFTTINGYSYYYIGLGGEIGYDAANGFADSIPVNGSPYNQTGTGFVQHIIDSSVGGPRLGGFGFNLIRDASGWCAAPHIGELYKDSDSDIWKGGLALSDYYRIDKDSDVAVPSAQRFYSGRRTKGDGCKAFYNLSNDGTTTFDHESNTADATILPTAHDAADIKSDMEAAFNMILPLTMTADRPWRLNSGNSKAEEWDLPAYASKRTKGNVLQVYYEHDNYADDGSGDPISGIASGLLQCYDPSDSDKVGYFAVHGIAKTQDIGSVFIGRYAIMSLLYSYLRAGSTDNALSPTTPLPLIEITSPTDMTALVGKGSNTSGVISVQWNLEWERWDEKAYTDVGTYNSNLSPGDDGFFKVSFSTDNRKTWKYLTSELPYEAGKPQDGGLEISSDITKAAGSFFDGYFLSSEPDDPQPKTRWNYAIAWDITNFEKGTYYIRVEYHRKDPVTGVYKPTHYSHNVMAINIEDSL